MVITTAASLGCRYILHLDTESRNESWEEKITKSILLVDEKQLCCSMAFPTLGQGRAPKQNCIEVIFNGLMLNMEFISWARQDFWYFHKCKARVNIFYKNPVSHVKWISYSTSKSLNFLLINCILFGFWTCFKFSYEYVWSVILQLMDWA